MVRKHELLGQLTDLRVGIDRILNMSHKNWQSNVATDKVTKVIDSFGQSGLYDGKYAS